MGAHQIPVTDDVIAVGGHVPGVRTLDRPLIGARFDDAADTWTLSTEAGQRQVRVLLDCRTPLLAWIPDLPGIGEFGGQRFHATSIASGFDPAAQRIAVIGADSTAGHLIGKLTRAGAAVTVFPLEPRRVVRPVRRARRYVRRQPDVASAPIEAVTASGIRSADGGRHDVDTIVFGTGFSISAEHPALIGSGGHELSQIWRDGDEPYLGVAVHGFPNYFILGGPDLEAQRRYVCRCLDLMAGHTRIEVRHSSYRVFNERTYLHPLPPKLDASAFDVSSADSRNEVYDGPATLTLAGNSRPVRVRLSGRIDPIDGRYHWQGTVFGELSEDLVTARALTVNAGDHSALARITEQTQQGTYSISGTGTPPFALARLDVPQA